MTLANEFARLGPWVTAFEINGQAYGGQYRRRTRRSPPRVHEAISSTRTRARTGLSRGRSHDSSGPVLRSCRRDRLASGKYQKSRIRSESLRRFQCHVRDRRSRVLFPRIAWNLRRCLQRWFALPPSRTLETSRRDRTTHPTYVSLDSHLRRRNGGTRIGEATGESFMRKRAFLIH